MEILAWHPVPRGTVQYERLWYAEPIGTEEVVFESRVFLLSKAKAEELKAPLGDPTQPATGTRAQSRSGARA